MKRVIILALICIYVSFAQRQTYYGTIGTYPITMSIDIDSVSDQIQGTYYYNKYKKDIQLSGHRDRESLSLFVYDSEGYIVETFSAIIRKTSLSGTWETWEYKKRTLPLTLFPDPWNDNVITQEEMSANPSLVFGNGTPDLGSGLGSPNKVDYTCDGSVYSLEYMKPILKTVEEIRNQTDRRCSGSMMYAQYRYYSFSLLKAMFAPDLFHTQQQELRARYTKHNKDYFTVQRTYFQHWGHSQLTNFGFYMHFITEEDGATKKHFGDDDSAAVDRLAAHFKRAYPGYASMSTMYAENLFELLLDRAVGGASYYTYKEAPRMSSLESKMRSSNPAYDPALDIRNTSDISILNRALRKAILWGQPKEILGKLIKQGAKLNDGHESPLFFALKSSLSTVEFLIEKGADVNYQNSFGKTPLFYAVGFSDTSLVKLLIKRGADVNAIYFSKAELDSVVKADSKPNYIDFCPLKHTKRSVLMHAAQNSDTTILKILLGAGATLHAVDELGYNAADYAKMEGKKENFAFLQKQGLTQGKL